MTYTKQEENIYFLNDKIIAQSLSEDGVNLIPSLELTKTEIDRVDDRINTTNTKLEGLSSEVKTISSDIRLEMTNVSSDIQSQIDSNDTDISFLSGKIDTNTQNLSTSVESGFVHLTGDTMTGKLSINGSLSVNQSQITLGKNATGKTGTFVWNGVANQAYTPVLDSAGTFNINPEQGVSGLYIGDESLDTILTKKLNHLSTELTTIVDTEDKAVFNILSDAIKLNEEEIKESLDLSVSNILNTGYLISNDFNLIYNSEANKITLVAGGKSVDIETTDFIRDGMLENAQLISIDGKQTLRLTFNVDTGSKILDIDVNNLVDIYTADGNGITVDTNHQFHLDYNIVATKANLDLSVGNVNQTLTTHANKISNVETKASTNEGSIATLNTNVSTINQTLTTHDSRLTTVEEKVQDNTQNIATLTGNLETTNTNLSETTGKLQTLSATVLGNEIVNADARSQLSGLTGRMTAVELVADEAVENAQIAQGYIIKHKAEYEALVDTVNNKIKIQLGDDANLISSDILNVSKISQNKYIELIENDSIDEQTIYIVSADFIHGFGQQIRHISNGTDDDHAVALNQLNTEKTAREEADTALGERIDGVISTHASDKTQLESAITAEVNRATAAEGALDGRVTTIANDYLKASDKTTLEGKITTAQGAAEAAQTSASTANGEIATLKGTIEALTARIAALEEQLNPTT